MSEPKNIILLVADSLRWDSVHQNGDHRLPWIGQRALRFDQARSGGCWTLPATASMFTGLSPHEHGADSQTRAISRVPTLAERMQGLGYSTHMITANVATTEIFGLDRGFNTLDRIWKMVPATAHKRIHEALVLVGKPRLRKQLLSKDFVMGKLSEDLDASKVWLQSTYGAVFDRTRELLDQNKAQNKRGFFFLNLMESHFPYHTADSFQTSAEGLFGQIREIISMYHLINQTWLTNNRQYIAPDMLNVLRRRQRLAWERLAPAIDAFAQEMREKYDATVAFCADHGDNFGEQNWLYHFSNITDAGNRVPLFIVPHDRDLGRVVQTPVSARDLYGTLLRMAGDRDPSLVSLADSTFDRSLPVLESFWYNNNGKTLPQFRQNQYAFVAGERRFAWRSGQWFEAPLTRGDEPEAPFIALDPSISPLHERVDTADRLGRLQRSFSEFSQFSAKIMAKNELTYARAA